MEKEQSRNKSVLQLCPEIERIHSDSVCKDKSSFRSSRKRGSGQVSKRSCRITVIERFRISGAYYSVPDIFHFSCQIY